MHFNNIFNVKYGGYVSQNIPDLPGIQIARIRIKEVAL